MFAGTAATIVSGAVAERIKFGAFYIFTFLMVAIIYPITGHWIWGGGWLAKLGVWDFAGSTVVHSVGGWAALAGIIVLGPRIGKYSKDGKALPIPGHSMTLGDAWRLCVVVWLVWIQSRQYDGGGCWSHWPDRGVDEYGGSGSGDFLVDYGMAVAR